MRRLFVLALIATAAFTSNATPAQGDPVAAGLDCDPMLRHRTAQEVLVSQRAALAAGDWDTVRCNYAEDAVVISDGGVVEGVDGIVAALQGFAALFGGAVPFVDDEVIVSILNDKAEMGRILFHISTPCIDIPDGTDTYIIRDGMIQAQTAHGFPVFKCFPPF